MSRPANATLLIADDQTDVLEALRLLLKPEGYPGRDRHLAGGGAGGGRTSRSSTSSWSTSTTPATPPPGPEGLELLARLQALDATLPVVVMTAWGSVELAVEAMRRGARDFVQKPWDNERLLAILRTQVALGRALRRGRRLEDENRLLRGEATGADLIAAVARHAAGAGADRRGWGPRTRTCSITGENGTGKERRRAAAPRRLAARRSGPW